MTDARARLVVAALVDEILSATTQPDRDACNAASASRFLDRAHVAQPGGDIEALHE